MAKKVLWQEMRRGEIGEAARAGGIVIVPLGSIEQHGPHLPVNTDICSSWIIAQRAAERVETFPVLVAPPIWWGLSPYHMVFPGTISLRMETFTALLADVCSSIHAHGFNKILLLNGHGGNQGFIKSVAIKLTAEGVPTAAVSYWDLIPKEMAAISQVDTGSIGHAGEMETSLQLYLQPHLVDRSAIGAHLATSLNMPTRRGVLAAGFFSLDIKRDAPQGVIGDPTAGTPEKGERIVEAAAVALAQFLELYQAL